MKQQFAIPSHYIAIFSWMLALFSLCLASLHNYLLFHSLAEIFSIIVACGIFMIAWNARRFLDNEYLLFIGISYLFIGGLDLIHTLAYKGMGVFQGYGANVPTQLWIASRYLESLSLLIAPLCLGRKLRSSLVFTSYSMLSVLMLGAIFYWRIFPDCFIEGVGLTPFKKTSEYVICFILVVSIALLARKQREFEKVVWQLLVVSIIVTIAAELAFTFYVSVYGIFNFFGHFCKIISFYLIYKAIIETGLAKPYDLLFRNLKKSEEALKESQADLERRVEERTAELLDANAQLRLEIEHRQNMERKLRESREEYRLLVESVPSIVYTGFKDWSVKFIDNKIELFTGYDADSFNSQRMKWSDILLEDDIETAKESFVRALKEDKSYVREYRIRTKAGRILWVQDRGRIICNDKGEIEYVSGVFFDITGQRQAQEEQNLLRQRLEALWEIARMTQAKRQELCDRVLTEIIDMTNSHYAFYGFLDENESVMTLYSWSREAMEECRIIDKPVKFPIAKAGLWANAVRKRTTITVNDYEQEQPNKKGLPEGHVPLNRILVVPIFSSGRIASVAAVANKSSDYKEEDARQIDAFATNVQVIMDSQQSREELRKSEQELRILSSRLLTTQENERGRIARELHDSIGQTLSAIKFKTENIIGEICKESVETALESCETLIPIIQGAIEEVRKISMDLRPSLLDDVGIIATISWFIREYQAIYPGIYVKIQITLEEREVPDYLRIVIFRILQEAMNNVAKHSKANVVCVSLNKTDGTIHLAVEDDGAGFALDEALSIEGSDRGFGLGSMRERTELSGGSFSINTAVGAGTAVHSLWPAG